MQLGHVQIFAPNLLALPSKTLSLLEKKPGSPVNPGKEKVELYSLL